MSPTNPYCQALGISVPDLARAKDHPDANFYSLLIVALLERGAPISLLEAAERFEQAGIAPAASALQSLKRCKPGRPPIYRDGDLYALDPHDDDTDFWVFRLELRPRRAPTLAVVRPAPAPLPSLDEPVTVAELDEAWHGGAYSAWSAQRLAICVLDAHQSPMYPAHVVAFVVARGERSGLNVDSVEYWRAGAIRVREDGRWELDAVHAAVLGARKAIRERISVLRRSAHSRPDPAVQQALIKASERRRAENGERLARMSRVLVHGFPLSHPKAVVLLDVGTRELTTFIGEELRRAHDVLARYDIIVGVQVRDMLRALAFDPGVRRLAELGPPQKTIQLNQRGRTLKITNTLLVQGSCGISRPIGDPKVMTRYLDTGQATKLRLRLEADAKSLYALYQYGRLHGMVRLRWGFMETSFEAPWAHPDETKLYSLMKQALDGGSLLEVVVGNAPGWSDPWARAFRVRVEQEVGGWQLELYDEVGYFIEPDDVQLARLVVADA